MGEGYVIDPIGIVEQVEEGCRLESSFLAFDRVPEGAWSIQCGLLTDTPEVMETRGSQT